jgi:hypothetical protein
MRPFFEVVDADGGLFVGVRPSSACSQLLSCQRLDVYVCSGGTRHHSNSGSGGLLAGSPM